MKWIQWLIDNAWTVIIVGTVLAQMFQAIFKKKSGEAAASPEEESAKEYEFEDPELAERTRKIREEIQRKIEQRSRGYTEPSPAMENPVAPPPVIREVVAQRPGATATAVTRGESLRHAEILEQQAVWEEKLREAQRMKASIQKRTAFEATTADHAMAVRAAGRGGLLADLHSPEALRRAFVLREVLGPPVGLRK